MDFINIFKFSNYIADKTDALLARYGHVNTLADTIAPPVATVDAGNVSSVFLTLNTTLGIIKNFTAPGIAMTTTTLNNNKINEDSIIFYKLIPSNTTELSDMGSDLIATQESGILRFTLKKSGASAVQGDIHFWILNPINQ